MNKKWSLVLLFPVFLQVYNIINYGINLKSILLFVFSFFFTMVLFYIRSNLMKEIKDKEIIFFRFNLIDSAINSSNFSFSITDADGKFIYANQGVLDEYPNLISIENIIGKKMYELEDSSETRRIHEENIEQVKNGIEISKFITYKGKNCFLSKTPLYDRNEKCIGMATIFIKLEA